MKNNYKFREKVIGRDVWHIHYLREDKTSIKITCDLLRPNRKFWQSKILWSDYAYCSADNLNLIEKFVGSIMTDYYTRQRAIEEIDNFFEEDS